MQLSFMGVIHQKPIYIALPGMKVYLNLGFFSGVVDRPPNWHSHPCFEIVCLKRNQEAFFAIIPPLAEHFSKTADNGRVCSFLFSFTNDSPNDICQIISKVDHEIEIKDTFDGFARIQSILEALKQNGFGIHEQTEAEFRLFFVKLAQVFYSNDKSKQTFPQTLDDERIALLENFFNLEMGEPNCSKRQLAAKIGVCERQLSRILKETYNSTFSEILLASRMNTAQAMLMQEEASIEKIAKSVGYTSISAFRNAYKNFFGSYPKRK